LKEKESKLFSRGRMKMNSKFFLKSTGLPGVVMHTCNPSRQEYHELKASMGYRVSLRPAWDVSDTA
jgi:hypothetical protein